MQELKEQCRKGGMQERRYAGKEGFSKRIFSLWIPLLKNICELSIKKKYLDKNKTKSENILTHWSVAQADSNDEKTGGRKSLWNILLTSFLLPKKRRWYNGKHSCLPSS